jgi:hypothetical protein
MTNANPLSTRAFHRPGRPYMPGLGRFITQAQLEMVMGGEHPYGYANNAPMMYADPTGERPCTSAESLNCYAVCGSQGARYTGSCDAEQFLGVVDVNCNCQPLLPKCECTPSELARLSLQVAIFCQAPSSCKQYLAKPPNRNRCAAIVGNMAALTGCIYAQENLNAKCFGGGDDGHNNKIEQKMKALNTCSRALQFNH